MAAIQNDFIIKTGLLVSGNTTVPATTNLATTNAPRSSARPTLDLNFTRSNSLDPRINFTRASVATYIDRDGYMKSVGVNQPRFNYDVSTGQCFGLLTEPSATNLITNSISPTQNSMFSGSTNSFKITTEIPPLHTSAEVFKSVRDTSGGDNNVGYWYGVVLSTTTFYTASAWIYIPSNSPPFTNAVMTFEGQNTTLIQAANTATVNQWQRIWTTGTNSTNTTSGIVNCLRMNGGTTGSYFYSTCWQLEATNAGIPTSYIPTYSASATRSAEAVSISGQNFNNFYTQGQGTLLIESYMPGPKLAVSGFAAALYKSASDYIGVQYVNAAGMYTGTNYCVYNGVGIQTDSVIDGNANFNRVNKTAVTYDSSGFVAVHNGAVQFVSSFTFAAIPLVTQLSIGGRAGSGTDFPGLVNNRRITYWPEKISTATLITLTGIN
jgi:hypothetical protein